jgi:hypothetical protein
VMSLSGLVGDGLAEQERRRQNRGLLSAKDGRAEPGCPNLEAAIRENQMTARRRRPSASAKAAAVVGKQSGCPASSIVFAAGTG